MPSVFVVPVYVEVPSGFERSIIALESHLRRAGYLFHTGDPLFETLEETKKSLAGGEPIEMAAENAVGSEVSP
ncbi:MAG: hypothetical protein JWN74_1989 [Acidobacteriaceae bacterium]|nr:hypothetical protein [Acidobacteriaceae bacterium]